MTAPSRPQPIVKGYCPGALRPMLSGDGLVVRIRPPLGRLSGPQAVALADLSTRFGNGVMDLTSRANVQLRGVRPDTHAALIDAMRPLDLIDDTAEGEACRNLCIAPFWETGDTTHRVATALDRALAAAPFSGLPSKFGFAVDCGATPVLRTTSADIRIEQGETGLIVRPDGCETGAPARADTAPGLALDLARWFLQSGGAPDGRGRMAPHIRTGAALPPAFRAATRQVGATETPRPGPTPAGALRALRFGQLQAPTLAALGRAGPLRLTPWRMILAEGAHHDTLPDCADLIADANDPCLRVSACTGAPGCPQALGPTRALAHDLAQRLALDTQGNETVLHVSGCTKGCAHPQRAALSVIARAPGRFDLVRDGRACDTPSARNLTPEMLKELL